MTSSSFPGVPGAARERTRQVTQAETRAEADAVIRPAAVIPETAAREVIRWLDRNRLEAGGLWSVGEANGMWQRFDRPWNGIAGTRGESQLVGTVHVTYDRPRRYEVVIHRVQITEIGLMAGWTTSSLVDEILRAGGLTLATCPRDTSAPAAYAKDPFRRTDAYRRAEGHEGA